MKTIRIQNIFAGALACALAFATTSTQTQAVSSAEAQAIALDGKCFFAAFSRHVVV